MENLHQVGPWVLLALSISGLLQVTVFYRVMLRWGQRQLGSGFLMRIASQSAVSGRALLLAERSLQSPGIRWFSATWSFALLLGAAAWFALRP